MKLYSAPREKRFFGRRYTRERSKRIRTVSSFHENGPAISNLAHSIGSPVSLSTLDPHQKSRIQRLVQKMPGPTPERNFEQDVKRLLNYADAKSRDEKRRHCSVGKAEGQGQYSWTPRSRERQEARRGLSK